MYFNKIIPLWVCLLIIYTVSMQRLITDMHSLSQVMVGAILGYIYAFLYTKFTFGLIIVFTIGLLLSILSVYKIDIEV